MLSPLFCRYVEPQRSRTEPPASPWESPKGTILDLLAKATPLAFASMLQIDGANAWLVVDALSGRWSYHKERTDRQNIFYHVANALSLAISPIAPETANCHREPITVITKFDIRKPQRSVTTNSGINVVGRR